MIFFAQRFFCTEYGKKGCRRVWLEIALPKVPLNPKSSSFVPIVQTGWLFVEPMSFSSHRKSGTVWFEQNVASDHRFHSSPAPPGDPFKLLDRSKIDGTHHSSLLLPVCWVSCFSPLTYESSNWTNCAQLCSMENVPFKFPVNSKISSVCYYWECVIVCGTRSYRLIRSESQLRFRQSRELALRRIADSTPPRRILVIHSRPYQPFFLPHWCWLNCFVPFTFCETVILLSHQDEPGQWVCTCFFFQQAYFHSFKFFLFWLFPSWLTILKFSLFSPSKISAQKHYTVFLCVGSYHPQNTGVSFWTPKKMCRSPNVLHTGLIPSSHC